MKTKGNEVTVRHDIRPGDIGEIVRLHGLLYSRERGWDHTFEGYVAEGLAEFVLSANRSRSRMWIMEKDKRLAGCIAVVGRNATGEAQLRWFLLDPSVRGQGHGRRLITLALEFCRSRKFRSVYLWTVEGLEPAGHIYRSLGFKTTEKKTHPLWGRKVTEVRYDLQLS